MCPQRKDRCGTKQDVSFDKEGETSDLTVTGIKNGESCSFRIKAKCGAPGFKVKDASTAPADSYDATYVEYTDGDVSLDANTGRPKPGTSMTDQGKQTKGQKRPPRKDAQGNLIKSKEFGKADDDRKPPPLFADQAAQKDTYTEGGYGKPTTGTYDQAVKGFKTFGAMGQGDKKEGLKDRMEDKCKPRTQIVSVTATKDTTDSQTVLLEVGAFAFDTSSAMVLKSAASFVALYSMSQF